jgi:soluble lytic murein transglycosylase-like protein
MRFLALALLLSACAWAGEFVVFTTGARLRVDRHEAEGAKVTLYAGQTVSEVDSSRIAGYEAEEPAPAAPDVRPIPAPPAPAPLTPLELADAAADKYGLPRQLVRSVMAAESAFQPKAISPKGAIGLMQLMPATAEILGANPHDPAQNVDAGARFLRNLLLKYDGKLWHALAAYNAGPATVDRYNAVPLYPETLRYIGRITRDLDQNPE